MNRVLQIFKKDVAHLWPQILVFLAALVLFACEDPAYVSHSPRGLADLINFLFILLPLACWLLVTSVIQEEKPIGDGQYWLTRPFSLAHLLGARALFLLLFVMAPVFLCQAIVLAANDLSPVEHLGDLIARQFFFAAWLLLPIAALAAVTRDLRHAFLGGLLALLTLRVGFSMLLSLAVAPLPWALATLAALLAFCGASASIAIQYTRRRTIVGRLVLFATVVVVFTVAALLPSRSILALESWLLRPSDPYAVRVSFDPGPKSEPSMDIVATVEVIRIPIRFENVPPDLQAMVAWSSVEFPFDSGWAVHMPRLTLTDPAHKFDKANDAPIHLRGVLGLVLVESARRTFRDCLTKDPWVPYSTAPWFGPLESCTTEEGHRPVAYIQRPFDLGPLRPADYVEMH